MTGLSGAAARSSACVGRPSLELLLGPAAGDDQPCAGARLRRGAMRASASGIVGAPIQFTSVAKNWAARMACMCESIRPGMTVRPCRSMTRVVGPASDERRRSFPPPRSARRESPAPHASKMHDRT